MPRLCFDSIKMETCLIFLAEGKTSECTLCQCNPKIWDSNASKNFVFSWRHHIRDTRNGKMNHQDMFSPFKVISRIIIT